MAPPWFPLPPQGYGGIEAVVHLLGTQLKEMGHQVTTFAAEGSDPRLRAVSMAPDDWNEDLGTSMQAVREATYEVRVNQELKERRREFDVVHLHTEFPGMASASLLGFDLPRLATVHGGISEEVVTFLEEIDEEIDLIAISKSQRKQAPTVRWLAVVHNAVRVDDFAVEDGKDGYLVQLARITPDKGQHLAIEVAERVGMPLVLAGKVDRDAKSRRFCASRHVRSMRSAMRASWRMFASPTRSASSLRRWPRLCAHEPSRSRNARGVAISTPLCSLRARNA